MAEEGIYDVAAYDYRRSLATTQAVLEVKLIPPPGVDIAKVFGVSAKAEVSTTEAFTGEARVKGSVFFRSEILSADGEVFVLSAVADFTDKITGDGITGQKPEVAAKVLDTDIVSVREDEIKLAAVVEMELFSVCGERIKYLVSGGDGVYTQEKPLTFTKFISSVAVEDTVTAEQATRGSRILGTNSTAVLLNVTAKEGNILFEGEIVAEILLASNEGVKGETITVPLVFEAEANGVTSGMETIGKIRIENEEITLIEGEENVISCRFNVEYSASVFEERTIHRVCDVFSVTNKLECSIEKRKIRRNKKFYIIKENVDGAVTLDNSMPIVDEIVLPVDSFATLSNVYTLNGRLILEGVVRTNILYFSTESNSVSSATAEIPFSLRVQADVCEGDNVEAGAVVRKVMCKIRRGNEIDIRTDIVVYSLVSTEEECELINALEVGEEIAPPSYALKMHIVRKKETLWDAAKALCATPDCILEQNPELVLPLVGGERIVCYRQLKKS